MLSCATRSPWDVEPKTLRLISLQERAERHGTVVGMSSVKQLEQHSSLVGSRCANLFSDGLAAVQIDLMFCSPVAWSCSDRGLKVLLTSLLRSLSLFCDSCILVCMCSTVAGGKGGLFLLFIIQSLIGLQTQTNCTLEVILMTPSTSM